MNTNYLEEFIYLANSLNFRLTAEHFFVNRSVISRHIAVLEKDLGTVLFERTTHGIELTEAGSVFLQEAQSVLRSWNLAKSRVQSLSGPEDTLVRVGYLRNGGRPFLAAFVKSMAENHPEVHLSLLCMEFEEAKQALLNHDIDVMLGINVNESMSNNYRSTLIYKDSFVVVCNRTHPVMKDKQFVTYDDLVDQKLLMPKSYVRSGMASHLHPLVDEDTMSEAEELYKDMDMLYLKIETEEYLALVSRLNASMFSDSLLILPISGLETDFKISAFYHDEFDGNLYKIFCDEFEKCRRSLQSEPPAMMHMIGSAAATD